MQRKNKEIKDLYFHKCIVHCLSKVTTTFVSLCCLHLCLLYVKGVVGTGTHVSATVCCSPKLPPVLLGAASRMPIVAVAGDPPLG